MNFLYVKAFESYCLTFRQTDMTGTIWFTGGQKFAAPGPLKFAALCGRITRIGLRPSLPLCRRSLSCLETLKSCLFCIGLEATVHLPRVEIKTNSTAVLVGDTVVLQCFAYLRQDGLIHMQWLLPSQVHCVTYIQCYVLTTMLQIHFIDNWLKCRKT